MPGEHQSAVHELVLEWLRSARADLAIARMAENPEIAPEIIAFHAQQTPEKALKPCLFKIKSYLQGRMVTIRIIFFQS